MSRWPNWILPLALLLPGAVQAATVDRIAAVVNSEVIALSEVYDLGGPFIAERCQSEVPIAPCQREAELEVLDSLILRTLITQQLGNLGMAVNADEVDRTIDQIGRDNGIEDREQFRAAIESQGVSWADYRAQLTEQIRQMKFNETVLRPRIAVSDNEVRDRYNRTVREYKNEPTYELEAIGLKIVPDPPEVPSEEAPQPTDEPTEAPEAVDPTTALIAAVASAREMVAAVNGGELDWATAIEQHDTLGRGGKMGKLKKDEMSPAIEAAVSQGETGKVAEPVVIGEMIFLIKIVAVEEAGVMAYEQVADRIRAQIFDEKIEDELEQWYQQTRRQASLNVLLEAP